MSQQAKEWFGNLDKKELYPLAGSLSPRKAIVKQETITTTANGKEIRIPYDVPVQSMDIVWFEREQEAGRFAANGIIATLLHDPRVWEADKKAADEAAKAEQAAKAKAEADAAAAKVKADEEAAKAKEAEETRKAKEAEAAKKKADEEAAKANSTKK